ncbi:O-acyltransferase [Spirochaetia bacterium]|nr:O-acyltransferase [Spirochaetia bacterium]
MTINSIDFLFFFSVVFFLYYFPLKEKTRAQNVLLLLASYVFYGIANWKMIPLLLLATGAFYGLGILIGKSNEANPKRAHLLTTLGVCLGIGFLLYFKYLNFFITSFSDLFSTIGLHTNWSTFTIIMPVGISFFTFKLISYVLEIYRQRMEPVTDVVAFTAYAAFFPTMLAGPIDRPNTFIPQLQAKRTFNYNLMVDGCRQILWGMFKKMVLADNCAEVVDYTWERIPVTSGSMLMIKALLYSIQLYADFSGYSDMAIGVGKLLGFRIAKNFNFPFKGKNIAEYWGNWHISLTSWLTDYVFMPLNIKFRDLGKSGIIFAIVINFVLVGLWHGANWTFVVFGLYHGLLYIPLILTGSFNRKNKTKAVKNGFSDLKNIGSMILTFILVSLGNIIFRADSIGQAWDYIHRIFSPSILTLPAIEWSRRNLWNTVCLLLSFPPYIYMEWIANKKEEYGFKNIAGNKILRWTIYIILILMILMIGGKQKEFIYFQF